MISSIRVAELDPALWQLVQFRAQAKVRRMFGSFRQRRRIGLSLFGLLLAAIWLGNSILSIVFRQASDPETVRAWMEMGFLAYALWHILKAAYQRPESPIEWIPAEREVLSGAPFSCEQLLLYRLTTVLGSALFKAIFFSLLMLPDLPIAALGFIGCLAALVFLDLWRMTVDVIAWGMRPAVYRRCRFLVIMTAVLLAVEILRVAVTHVWQGSPESTVDLFMGLLESGGRLSHTSLGRAIQLPFSVFANLSTSTSLNTNVAILAATSVLLGVTQFTLLSTAYRHFVHDVASREREDYRTSRERGREAGLAEEKDPVAATRGYRWSTLALAARQWVGVRAMGTSILISLIAPLVLSCVPLLVFHDAEQSLLNVVGSLAFYTFLLLPAALKFDFRRDVQRMVLLKSLPLSPSRIALEQVLVPVLIACSLQALVLAILFFARPVSLLAVSTSFALLLPLNMLIFCLDNAIYLHYPYRLNDEGLQIFIRTTLTFTAKGLLFALGVGMVLLWAGISHWLTRQLGLPPGPYTFIAGLWCLLACSAWITFGSLVNAFRRFDASQDIPA